MIFLKTEDEIELMRAANQLVAKTLAEVGRHVRPGVTTKELDRVAEEFIAYFQGLPQSLWGRTVSSVDLHLSQRGCGAWCSE